MCIRDSTHISIYMVVGERNIPVEMIDQLQGNFFRFMVGIFERKMIVIDRNIDLFGSIAASGLNVDSPVADDSIAFKEMCIRDRLQHCHISPPVSLPQQARVLKGKTLEQLSLADQLSQLGNPHIKIYHLIPGRFAHHTICCQPEGTLKDPDCLLCLGIIDAGDRPYLWDGWIALRLSLIHI